MSAHSRNSPRADHPLERLAADEIIVDPVGFARPGRPGGVRPGPRQCRASAPPAARPRSSCRCPDGAETTNSSVAAGRPGGADHSTFCTCSRTRSSSALAAMTISVARRALDLRPDRVDLAVHLLHQEVELAAARLRTARPAPASGRGGCAAGRVLRRRPNGPRTGRLPARRPPGRPAGRPAGPRAARAAAPRAAPARRAPRARARRRTPRASRSRAVEIASEEPRLRSRA